MTSNIPAYIKRALCFVTTLVLIFSALSGCSKAELPEEHEGQVIEEVTPAIDASQSAESFNTAIIDLQEEEGYRLFKEGKYKEASEIFKSLGAQDNAFQLWLTCKMLLGELKPGETFEFGTLGSSPICWVLVEIDNGRLKAISEKGLFYKEFDSTLWVTTELEKSPLGQYLSGTFSSGVFGEYAGIVEKITLPSVEEITKYPMDSKVRACGLSGTEGSYTPNKKGDEHSGEGKYWTRDKGRGFPGSSFAITVVDSHTGEIDQDGISAEDYALVRPLIVLSFTFPRMDHSHLYGEWIEDIPSDCVGEQVGLKHQICSECGFAKMATTSVGHVYGTGEVLREPTCGASGTTRYVCIKCGDEKLEETTVSHTWEKATCTTPRTCKFCGLEDGNPLGHTTELGECSRCGEEFYQQCPLYVQARKIKTADGGITWGFTFTNKGSVQLYQFQVIWECLDEYGNVLTDTITGEKEFKYTMSIRQPYAGHASLKPGHSTTEGIWKKDFHNDRFASIHIIGIWIGSVKTTRPDIYDGKWLFSDFYYGISNVAADLQYKDRITRVTPTKPSHSGSHTVNEVILAEPKCSATGLTGRVCEDCDYAVYTETFVEHTWTDETCLQDVKCTQCKAIKTSAPGHTCVAGECERCKEEIKASSPVYITMQPVMNGDATQWKVRFKAGAFSISSVVVKWQCVDANGTVLSDTLSGKSSFKYTCGFGSKHLGAWSSSSVLSPDLTLHNGSYAAVVITEITVTYQQGDEWVKLTLNDFFTGISNVDCNLGKTPAKKSKA